MRGTYELAAEIAAEIGEPMGNLVAVGFEEGAARQREPIAVDAVAFNADHRVAFAHVFPDNDPIERHVPDRGAGEIESMDHVLELGGLSARDRNARHLRAGAEPDGNRIQDFRLNPFDGDVIHHGNRSGAYADDVIDVHRDAIDSHGVVFSQHGCDHGLRADAVGGDRNALAADVDDVCKVADVELDRSEAPARRPGAGNARGELLEAGFGLVGIDPGIPVAVVDHAHIGSRCGFDGSRHSILCPLFAMQHMQRQTRSAANAHQLPLRARPFEAGGPPLQQQGPENLWRRERSLRRHTANSGRINGVPL